MGPMNLKQHAVSNMGGTGKGIMKMAYDGADFSQSSLTDICRVILIINIQS